MKDVTHGDDDYIIIIAEGVNVLKGFFVIIVTSWYGLGFGINNVKMLKAACGYVSYLVLLVWDLILLESQSYGNNRFSCLWNLCDLLIYSGDDYLECVDHGSSIGYGWVNYGKSYELMATKQQVCSFIAIEEKENGVQVMQSAGTTVALIRVSNFDSSLRNKQQVTIIYKADVATLALPSLYCWVNLVSAASYVPMLDNSHVLDLGWN
ncbi:hypothetical protein Tco_0628341 [Tanacetum coccineum]|uniref:Uncharacterized protein n=1 Tax=Tanacetum coccineum TaxID=301880 RepID=A0ABQ4WQ10_9ASTR